LDLEQLLVVANLDKIKIVDSSPSYYALSSTINNKIHCGATQLTTSTTTTTTTTKTTNNFNNNYTNDTTIAKYNSFDAYLDSSKSDNGVIFLN
jgi:hypothetical protein